MDTAATIDTSFRLEHDEDPPGGIRRVAIERADHALAELAGFGRQPPITVHEVRKDLKMIRSTLRLVRERLGSERFGAENARLRTAGRALAPARDAQIKVELLEALAGGPDTRVAAGLSPWLEALTSERDLAHHLLAGSDSGESIGWVRTELEAVRESVPSWPLDDLEWDQLGPGLLHEFERGRKRFEQVRSAPLAAFVHEWRKRVKDLWYHLRLGRGAWPSVLGPLADEAHSLSTLLGDHHDLSVLAEDAADRPGLIGELLAGTRAEIDHRQSELLSAALPAGERIYAEEPEEFAARIGAYWQAWKGS